VEVDVGKPEPSADEPAVPEDLLDLVRACVGRDVEVLGLSAQEQVSHAAADQIGEMTRFLKSIEDPNCVGADPFAGDGMIGPGDDDGLLAHGRIVTQTCPEGKEGKHARTNGNGILSAPQNCRKLV
jgi:hypothetical protein